MMHRQEIIVANSYVYNHYRDGKEVDYFLSTDKINSVAVLPLSKASTYGFVITFSRCLNAGQ